MNQQSFTRQPIARGLAMAFLVLLGGPALAQTQFGLGERVQHRLMTQMPQALDFIDLSAVPGQRPRGSLRFRFEGATRTLRGWGMDADDCRTLVRTHTQRANIGDPPTLGVTVSLNCSFF